MRATDKQNIMNNQLKQKQFVINSFDSFNQTNKNQLRIIATIFQKKVRERSFDDNRQLVEILGGVPLFQQALQKRSSTILWHCFSKMIYEKIPSSTFLYKDTDQQNLRFYLLLNGKVTIFCTDSQSLEQTGIGFKVSAINQSTINIAKRMKNTLHSSQNQDVIINNQQQDGNFTKSYNPNANQESIPSLNTSQQYINITDPKQKVGGKHNNENHNNSNNIQLNYQQLGNSLLINDQYLEENHIVQQQVYQSIHKVQPLSTFGDSKFWKGQRIMHIQAGTDIEICSMKLEDFYKIFNGVVENEELAIRSKLFKNAPIFSYLQDEDYVENIICRVNQKTYKRQEVIYKEGDDSNSFFLVKNGELRISQNILIDQPQQVNDIRRSSSLESLFMLQKKKIDSQLFLKQNISICIVQQGHVFGLEELLKQEKKRPYTVTVLSNRAELYILNIQTFPGIIEKIQNQQKSQKKLASYLNNKINWCNSQVQYISSIVQQQVEQQHKEVVKNLATQNKYKHNNSSLEISQNKIIKTDISQNDISIENDNLFELTDANNKLQLKKNRRNISQPDFQNTRYYQAQQSAINKIQNNEDLEEKQKQYLNTTLESLNMQKMNSKMRSITQQSLIDNKGQPNKEERDQVNSSYVAKSRGRFLTSIGDGGEISNISSLTIKQGQYMQPKHNFRRKQGQIYLSQQKSSKNKRQLSPGKSSSITNNSFISSQDTKESKNFTSKCDINSFISYINDKKFAFDEKYKNDQEYLKDIYPRSVFQSSEIKARFDGMKNRLNDCTFYIDKKGDSNNYESINLCQKYIKRKQINFNKIQKQYNASNQQNTNNLVQPIIIQSSNAVKNLKRKLKRSRQDYISNKINQKIFSLYFHEQNQQQKKQ